MKKRMLNHKQVVLILVTILLTYGMSDISYAQVCSVGDILSPGESCTYPGTEAEFSVLNDGRGQFLFFTSGSNLNISNITINGVVYTLVAKKTHQWFLGNRGNCRQCNNRNNKHRASVHRGG